MLSRRQVTRCQGLKSEDLQQCANRKPASSEASHITVEDGGGSVTVWARVAAGGTGLLVFLDDMSADRIFKMRLVCPDSKIAVITKELL